MPNLFSSTAKGAMFLRLVRFIVSAGLVTFCKFVFTSNRHNLLKWCPSYPGDPVNMGRKLRAFESWTPPG